MLDFDKLDHALEAAVGVAPDALLRAAAARWADRFLLARERLSELSEVQRASQAEVLERDRLASFFGCAYGDHGLLARAGALYTLKSKIAALADALPRLAAEPSALGAARREVAILRALADHRLSEIPHSDDDPLRARLAELESAIGDLQAFSSASSQSLRSVGIAATAGHLYGAADLVNTASDFKDGMPVLGLVAFVLGRLADRGFTKETRSLLHELCAEHAGRIREQLWAVGLDGFRQRGRPATLAELRELDLALEGLRAELVHDGRAGSLRAQAVSALWTLLALARAQAAQKLADAMLDGAVLLIAEGLAAEARPSFPRPGGGA